MPYSCHAQLGTSGRSGWPIGGGSTVRGIAPSGLQFSTLTIVHTATRALPGNVSLGRLWIGRYGVRPQTLSPGSVIASDSFYPQDHLADWPLWAMASR